MSLLPAALAAILAFMAPAAGAEEAYQAGQALVNQGNLGEAETQFRRAIEIDPEYIRAYVRLGTILAWSERHDESIAVYEQALAVDPLDYDARLGLAKVTSWAGQYARSTELYEELLKERPGDRTLSMGLAGVSSWDKQFGRSIRIYEEILERDPADAEARLGLARVTSWDRRYGRSITEYRTLLRDDPANKDAGLGLARTLGWAGRLEEAEVAYRDYLADHPDDLEARNGLAAVLSWSRKLDESLEMYEGTLAMEPGDPTALAGRARILWWQGRRPEAWSALDEALGAHPGDAAIRDLQGSFMEGVAPVADTAFVVVHDSDRNSMVIQRTTFSFTPTDRTAAGIRFDRFDATQPPVAAVDLNNRLSAKVETLSVFGSFRQSERWTFHGSAGGERIQRGTVGSASHATGSAGASYRLSDRWTLGATLARQTLAATAHSLESGIRHTTATLSATYLPRPRLSSRFSAQIADFSDGNRRDLLTASIRWATPLKRPELALSWSERYFAYDNGDPTARNGYFSPDSYWAHVATVEVSHKLAGKLGLRAEVYYGLQRVDLQDSPKISDDTVRGYHVGANFPIWRNLYFDAYHSRTNLALSAGGGLSSSTSGVYRSEESGFKLRWRIDGLRLGTHKPRERRPETSRDEAEEEEE